jgi:hypothetical protein
MGGHYRTYIISSVSHPRSNSVKLLALWMVVYNGRGTGVMPPKLALANLVESLTIYPVETTCDQTRNRPYKNVRVNAREGE